MNSLYADLPAGAGEPAEEFVGLLARPSLKIERIVSAGQASPADFGTTSQVTSWCFCSGGEAKLAFEGEPAARVLKPGDFVDAAPHRRHQVEWTHPCTPTVWPAVHYG